MAECIKQSRASRPSAMSSEDLSRWIDLISDLLVEQKLRELGLLENDGGAINE